MKVIVKKTDKHVTLSINNSNNEIQTLKRYHENRKMYTHKKQD